jgi:hypothetical protein
MSSSFGSNMNYQYTRASGTQSTFPDLQKNESTCLSPMMYP